MEGTEGSHGKWCRYSLHAQVEPSQARDYHCFYGGKLFSGQQDNERLTDVILVFLEYCWFLE